MLLRSLQLPVVAPVALAHYVLGTAVLVHQLARATARHHTHATR